MVKGQPGKRWPGVFHSCPFPCYREGIADPQSSELTGMYHGQTVWPGPHGLRERWLCVRGMPSQSPTTWSWGSLGERDSFAWKVTFELFASVTIFPQWEEISPERGAEAQKEDQPSIRCPGTS